MSTLNNVELAVVSAVLSIFFILGAIFTVELIKTLKSINNLSKKAESFINSAQSAAETIQHLGSASKQNFPLLRIINHIFENSKTKRK